jgi:hypothetical protein
MRISNKKFFIDLKYFSSEWHSPALNCEEMVDEFWKNDIYSNHGLPAGIRMGIRGKISCNTLAHANQTRDWRI